MPTLNAGAAEIRGDKVSVEDRALIADFLLTKKVEHLKPAGLDGNEASLATRDRVAQARQEFRNNKRKSK